MWQHRWQLPPNFAFILRFAVSESPLHGMGQSDQQLRCAVQYRTIHFFIFGGLHMNQHEPHPCCVNCSISGVPLYLGLDGKLHCADHIGLLLNPSKQTPVPTKNQKGA